MKKDNGGTIFPSDTGVERYGLSRRDYFAAMALNGLCSGVNALVAELPDWQERVVRCAYSLADYMLLERKKEG